MAVWHDSESPIALSRLTQITQMKGRPRSDRCFTARRAGGVRPRSKSHAWVNLMDLRDRVPCSGAPVATWLQSYSTRNSYDSPVRPCAWPFGAARAARAGASGSVDADVFFCVAQGGTLQGGTERQDGAAAHPVWGVLLAEPRLTSRMQKH